MPDIAVYVDVLSEQVKKLTDRLEFIEEENKILQEWSKNLEKRIEELEDITEIDPLGVGQ